MNRALVPAITGRVLAIAAATAGVMVKGENTTDAGERFSMQLVCPEETLVWTVDDFTHLSLVQTAESGSSAIAFEFEYEAAVAFSDLTKRSIGLMCELYGNDVLIASLVIRSPIHSATGIVEMDAELAKILVESYEADRTFE